MVSQIPANLKANRSKNLHAFSWECNKMLYQLWKVERKEVLRKRAALLDPSMAKL